MRAWFVVYTAVLSVHVLVVLGQPLFAGAFLNGDYDALTLHEIGGDTAAATCLLALVAAVLQWRPGGGSRRLPLLGGLLLAGEVGQTVLGYQHQLGLHVPLGVAVVGCAVALEVSALRRLAGQRRSVAARQAVR